MKRKKLKEQKNEEEPLIGNRKGLWKQLTWHWNFNISLFQRRKSLRRTSRRCTTRAVIWSWLLWRTTWRMGRKKSETFVLKQFWRGQLIWKPSVSICVRACVCVWSTTHLALQFLFLPFSFSHSTSQVLKAQRAGVLPTLAFWWESCPPAVVFLPPWGHWSSNACVSLIFVGFLFPPVASLQPCGHCALTSCVCVFVVFLRPGFWSPEMEIFLELSGLQKQTKANFNFFSRSSPLRNFSEFRALEWRKNWTWKRKMNDVLTFWSHFSQRTVVIVEIKIKAALAGRLWRVRLLAEQIQASLGPEVCQRNWRHRVFIWNSLRAQDLFGHFTHVHVVTWICHFPFSILLLLQLFFLLSVLVMFFLFCPPAPLPIVTIETFHRVSFHFSKRFLFQLQLFLAKNLGSTLVDSPGSFTFILENIPRKCSRHLSSCHWGGVSAEEIRVRSAWRMIYSPFVKRRACERWKGAQTFLRRVEWICFLSFCVKFHFALDWQGTWTSESASFISFADTHNKHTAFDTFWSNVVISRLEQQPSCFWSEQLKNSPSSCEEFSLQPKCQPSPESLWRPQTFSSPFHFFFEVGTVPKCTKLRWQLKWKLPIGP